MEQGNQDNQYSSAKWTPIVLAVLSSTNAGTGAYILALTFISFYPLAYALLPPLKPGSAVDIFKDTVKATIAYHEKHKSLLNGSDSFDMAKVKKLEEEARSLKVMHTKAHQGLSLTSVASWLRYAAVGWSIWVEARGYQREIDALKGELKILVLQAKEA